MQNHVPVAWRQLVHSRGRFVAASGGVVFAVLLMWMQISMLTSALDSTTAVHRRIGGDLILASSLTETIAQPVSIPRREMTRSAAHPDVLWARPFYSGAVRWKTPGDSHRRQVSVYGVDPARSTLRIQGLEEHALALRDKDVCLVDDRSRREFEPILAPLRRGEKFRGEAGGRTVTAVGLTSIGVTLGVDATLIVNESNFLRTTGAEPGAISFGIIRLRAGADVQRARRELQSIHGKQYRVMTPDDFRSLELDYQMRKTPITFIFSIGATVGFLVGFAIVAQILFTEVSNTLPQYATLMAIGYSVGYLRRTIVLEGLYLSFAGYPIGTAAAGVLLAVISRVTGMPTGLSIAYGLLILFLTLLMCVLAGLFAVRKLSKASPADVF